MDSQKTIRILIQPAQDGAVNMAIDEAILEAVNAGKSPTTLRFYQWKVPTISLGYFQKHKQFLGQAGPITKMPLVRRQTGGGAILHNDELTYSLVLPLDGSVELTDIETMYLLVHDGYIEQLRTIGVNAEYRGGSDKGNAQRGPFFCFARGHRLDLVVGNDKLLGSAQRRIKNAVLQHGSLIFERHFNEQPSAELNKLAKGPLDIENFAKKVARHIADGLGLTPQEEQLSQYELKLTEKLQADKYSAASWNHQR